jgi:hypothetical protein
MTGQTGRFPFVRIMRWTILFTGPRTLSAVPSLLSDDILRTRSVERMSSVRPEPYPYVRHRRIHLG